MTDTTYIQRTQRRRDKIRKAGGARLDVWLTPESVAALAALTAGGLTKAQAINNLLAPVAHKGKE